MRTYYPMRYPPKKALLVGLPKRRRPLLLLSYPPKKALRVGLCGECFLSAEGTKKAGRVVFPSLFPCMRLLFPLGA